MQRATSNEVAAERSCSNAVSVILQYVDVLPALLYVHVSEMLRAFQSSHETLLRKRAGSFQAPQVFSVLRSITTVLAHIKAEGPFSHQHFPRIFCLKRLGNTGQNSSEQAKQKLPAQAADPSVPSVCKMRDYGSIEVVPPQRRNSRSLAALAAVASLAAVALVAGTAYLQHRTVRSELETDVYRDKWADVKPGGDVMDCMR